MVPFQPPGRFRKWPPLKTRLQIAGKMKRTSKTPELLFCLGTRALEKRSTLLASNLIPSEDTICPSTSIPSFA